MHIHTEEEHVSTALFSAVCCEFQCIAFNLVEKATRMYHCTIAFKLARNMERKLGLCSWNYLYGNYHKVVITSWNCLVNKLF